MTVPATRDRDRHARIVDRIDELLGGRSWSWLARETQVPQSTLSDQKRRWFSESVLARIARVFGVDPGFLLAPEEEKPS